jgi:hypothetical protein
MKKGTTMSLRTLLLVLLLTVMGSIGSLAQKMPLVYQVENTGSNVTAPAMRSFNDLPTITSLPDPFRWADSSARLVYYSDWRRRRAEISAQVQHYLLGKKPLTPDSLEASFANNTLTVTITVGGKSLTLTATITRPAGNGPFPAVIGVGSATGGLPADYLTGHSIATIVFNDAQLAPLMPSIRGKGGFYTLYPDTTVGSFTAWAWGVSRIIDGLYKTPETNIDLRHLAVGGCSHYAKMALYAGAMDERIALTIAKESGGGGDATWRFSQTIGPTAEILSSAQRYGWYVATLPQFNDAVTKLPFDQHEVLALIAPRALLVLGNPTYAWLADESGYVGCKAAGPVWEALGIAERFGFARFPGFTHCSLPAYQSQSMIAFVQKFLLGDSTATTNIATADWHTNLAPWIPWTTYPLSNDLTAVIDCAEVPAAHQLTQNYPNPFNPSTTIRFAVQRRSHVELTIYDGLGRLVRTLVDEDKGSGTYEVVWNGNTGSGVPVASGVYVCRIEAGGFVASQKMICIR